MSIQLIVGLANPGKEYALTRHNAGAWWVQALSKEYNFNLQTESKLQATIGTLRLNNQQVRCAIPNTFMNHSGQAVAKIAKYFSIPAEQILVVHDELDFPAGIIRIKQGGGHGGHNGLRDIVPQLGSNSFYRLRVGIGHPGDKSMVADYVLNNPSSKDKQLIEQAINQSIQFAPDIIAGNWQTVMNKLHQES